MPTLHSTLAPWPLAPTQAFSAHSAQCSHALLYAHLGEALSAVAPEIELVQNSDKHYIYLFIYFLRNDNHSSSNKVTVNQLDKKSNKLALASRTYYGTMACRKPKPVRKIDLYKGLFSSKDYVVQVLVHSVCHSTRKILESC